MSESAVTSTFAMGLLVYWILVGSPCSFAWTNLPLRKSHWASITTLFMTSRVHVWPGTPRNDSVLKSLRSLSDFFHSAVALSSSLTPSASDFQTPVAKPATAMQPPSAGWSSGGVSFPVGGQTDRHERMSLGRWGCGAGVAGREWRLETLTVILAGVRFSFLALLLLLLLLGLLVACTSAQGQRNRRSHKKQDRMSLRRWGLRRGRGGAAAAARDAYHRRRGIPCPRRRQCWPPCCDASPAWQR